MNIAEVKERIQESIDRQLKEIASIKANPPKSFLAYKMHISDALIQFRAPRPLVEAVFEARGQHFAKMWENWQDVKLELDSIDPSETHQVWQEIRRHYVRDVAKNILREFTEGTINESIYED